MSFTTESTFRSITTPSPVDYLEHSGFRSISPSYANQHLDDLDKDIDLKQIQKVLCLIQDPYEAKFSIPIDPGYPVTWMNLFKDPVHAGSRLHSHHMNVCFCFLFAVAIDPDLEGKTKTDMTTAALQNLSLGHSFDLYNSFLNLPPIMAIFILPHTPVELKNYVFQNVSDPDLVFSWTSIVFEHRSVWPESAQKYFMSSLNIANFPSSRVFRIHTSPIFKAWFSLIKTGVATDSNARALHHSGTTDSLGSFNYMTEPNALSQKLLTLYSFIKEGKAERIQETIAFLRSENLQGLLDSFLDLSPASATHILTQTPPDIQTLIFKETSNETLLLWMESAFEYQDSIGPEVLDLIALHVKTPSFLPYFHQKAEREIREWAERIAPEFFPPAASYASCHCIVS